jgi:hypothetical protein
MLKKLILIGGLLVSMVAMSGTHAHAQFFDSWGWFGFSALRGEIDLSKVPNPSSKPRIVFVQGILSSIEVICFNPANHNVAPGNAGTRTATGQTAISGDNITDRKRGLAHVTVFLGATELAAAEATASCVTPQWTVVPGSAAPKQASLEMKLFACVPESHQDPEPCFNDVNGDGNSITIDLAVNPDNVKLLCNLASVARDQSGIPLHGQTMTCVEVP